MNTVQSPNINPQPSVNPNPIISTPTPPPTKSSSSPIKIILLLIIVLVLGIMLGNYFNLNQTISSLITPQPKSCTMEAKLCPDGTSVGRVTPTCEFSPCPTPVATPDLSSGASAKEDPTAEWKTYTNTRYGYQLKHPTDWSVTETEGATDSQIVPGFKNQMVELTNKTDSIKIFFEGEWDHGFEPWVPILNTSTVIDGEKTSLVVMKQNLSDKPEGGWAIYTIPDLHNFRIEAIYTKEIDQILSTFKFLDETGDTSSWKTHESERFKYSFKYPQEMIIDNQAENKYSDQGGINIYSQDEYNKMYSKNPTGPMEGGSFINSWTYLNSKNLTTLGWMNEAGYMNDIENLGHSGYSGQEYSPIKIGDDKGFIYKIGGGGRSGFEAVIAKNNYIYTFSSTSNYEHLLNQIISTVKFLE